MTRRNTALVRGESLQGTRSGIAHSGSPFDALTGSVPGTLGTVSNALGPFIDAYRDLRVEESRARVEIERIQRVGAAAVALFEQRGRVLRAVEQRVRQQGSLHEAIVAELARTDDADARKDLLSALATALAQDPFAGVSEAMSAIGRTPCEEDIVF